MAQRMIYAGVPAALAFTYTAENDSNELLGRQSGSSSKNSRQDLRLPKVSAWLSASVGSKDGGASLECYPLRSGTRLSSATSTSRGSGAGCWVTARLRVRDLRPASEQGVDADRSGPVSDGVRGRDAGWAVTRAAVWVRVSTHHRTAIIRCRTLAPRSPNHVLRLIVTPSPEGVDTAIRAVISLDIETTPSPSAGPGPRRSDHARRDQIRRQQARHAAEHATAWLGRTGTRGYC